MRKLCQAAGVHVAIRNAPDQFVIGGHSDDMDHALKAARAAGAERVTPLPVAVPSHTPLLRDAARKFIRALRKYKDAPPPEDRLLSGIDGEAVFDAAAGLDKLGRQIGQMVDWAACLDACRAAGASRALELGPGSSLARMMGEVLGSRDSRSLSEFRSVDGAVSWLVRRNA